MKVSDATPVSPSTSLMIFPQPFMTCALFWWAWRSSRQMVKCYPQRVHSRLKLTTWQCFREGWSVVSQAADIRIGKPCHSLSPRVRIFVFYNRKIIVIFAESNFSSGAEAIPGLNLFRGVHYYVQFTRNISTCSPTSSLKFFDYSLWGWKHWTSRACREFD